MMADTYTVMTSLRRGLFNYNIIKMASCYKLDKYYGGLVLHVPPFSIFSFIMIPFYLCISDKSTLASMNKGFYICSAVTLYIPLSVIFIAINILLMPFAYLMTIIQKLNLVC